MKTVLAIVLTMFCANIFSQKEIQCMPYLNQGGIYYSSNHNTYMGVGMGGGMVINYKVNWLLQADANIYWLNGTSFKNSIGVGYKKTGVWSPAIMGNIGIMWGSHTEVLFDDGSRPAPVKGMLQLKLAPLRFENTKGFVSLMEFGYGWGRYQGRCSELSLVSIGIKF